VKINEVVSIENGEGRWCYNLCGNNVCVNRYSGWVSLWMMIMLLAATTSSVPSIFDHDNGNATENVLRCPHTNRQL